MDGSNVRSLTICAAAALALMLSGAPGMAQPDGSGGMGMRGMGMGGMQRGVAWGAGGLGMLGLGAGGCGPRATEFAEWRLTRIERLIRPTDAQRPKFDEFRKAATRAREVAAAACPAEIPQSPIARMELMEKRLTATLEAMKVVRPALTELYESLDTQQQARFNASGPGRRGWRWQQR